MFEGGGEWLRIYKYELSSVVTGIFVADSAALTMDFWYLNSYTHSNQTD